MPSRRTSPMTRRRYNPDYHQMGDHTLFHNGTTARMFPALGKMTTQQLSELFGVPEVDRQSERLAEVRFAEPYDGRQSSFRTFDAPVRDEQQNKIITRGGIVSASFSNDSRPPTASNTLRSSINSLNGRPTTAASGTTYRSVGSSSRPPTAGTITEDGRYLSNTVRLHGDKQFKVHNEVSAKSSLVNTIPSLCIGFDVDETIHMDSVRRTNEAKAKQTRISSPIKRKEDKEDPPQVLKPFSAGTEAAAKGRLANEWYLNSGHNALAIRLQQLKQQNKIDRENQRVAKQRYELSPSQSPRR